MFKFYFLLSIVFFICGCEKEEYPSTATVKLDILQPGDSTSGFQISQQVYDIQPLIIKGNTVLSKAANGAITEVLWIEENDQVSDGLKTDEFIKTRLMEILSGSNSARYTRKFVPVLGQKQPLKNTLAKIQGQKNLISDTNAVRFLSRNIDIETVQSTGEVRITAYSIDASAAKEIADMVAMAYVSFIDEDNAEKVEKMIGNLISDAIIKQTESMKGDVDIEGMKAELSKIKEKYKLEIDATGIPKKPSEISAKESEMALLRPEIVRVKTTFKQITEGSYDDKVRYFCLNGNQQIADQNNVVTDLKMEIRRLGIEILKDSEEKEGSKAQLKESETKLKAEEAKLSEYISTAMEEFKKTLSEKETTLLKIEADIHELENNFFTGSAEYSELVRRIESSKITEMEKSNKSLPVGFLLNAAVSSYGELSTVPVKRFSLQNSKWLFIGGGIVLVLILNLIFIIYLLRWAKAKKDIN